MPSCLRVTLRVIAGAIIYIEIEKDYIYNTIHA